MNRKGYIGESNWPLRAMNIHRYFLYLAILFLGVACLRRHQSDSHSTAISASVSGLSVLTVNVLLLAGYTFGCHSLRHLVGGVRDCVSESPTCRTLYKGCSSLNQRHYAGPGRASWA